MDDLAIRLSGQGAGQAYAGPSADLATWRDYVDLLKPRVMMLVVFTGIAGMVAAPGATEGAIHPVIALTAILALTVGAGAAGAINMWFDRDIDAIMPRTATRPIPAGRVAPDAGLTFALFMAAASVYVMGMAVNWVSAGLLAFAIWFYAVFYTMWLKRSTPQNIVIGGAAGAFPPLIGWAAVTGDVTLLPILLFGIIFLWTPPHF
ncbi:MAG: heme o synthase, partial [Pseudomonadota bacterium]